MSQSAPLYLRKLPGGGYVMIEQVEDGSGDGDGYRAYLRVERRTDPYRRDGHTPPVIAEATGTEATAVLAELQAIAANNVSVAQRILRWQARKA